MTNKISTLDSLENSVPFAAYGYTVSMYSIALEGWRRGLTLKFINKNRPKAHTFYSLSDGKKEHIFSVSRGDKVPSDAIKICVNKSLTKKELAKHNVPVPEGEVFTESNADEELIKYASRLGYPVVLKPVDGTGGHGVIANIKDEEEFRNALDYVKYTLKYKELIVEKYFAGEDHRLYIVNNQVIGAFRKIPANVIGDGVRSIRELLKIKNEERTSIPALHNRPIKPDQETDQLLKSKGYTLNTVPDKGEQVFLKSKNNVSSGGDPIDTTDELSDEIKEIAVNASKAIPGLVQCGLDMMVDKQTNTGVVLEVNSRPQIRSHLYPMQGKARDIPKAIIDYYFPETVQNTCETVYYFDFQMVYVAFSSGICKEFVVPNHPKGNLTSTRFRIKGVWGSESYKKWVKKQSLKLNLHGYIKHLQNGQTSVVVSGSVSQIEKFRNIINNESPRSSKPKEVIEKTWNKPVKIGFELKENSVRKTNKQRTKRIDRNRSTKSQNKVNNYNYRSLKVERDYYKQKYLNMRDSKLWRATAPVRMVMKKIRGNNE